MIAFSLFSKKSKTQYFKTITDQNISFSFKNKIQKPQIFFLTQHKYVLKVYRAHATNTKCTLHIFCLAQPYLVDPKIGPTQINKVQTGKMVTYNFNIDFLSFCWRACGRMHIIQLKRLIFNVAQTREKLPVSSSRGFNCYNCSMS
jgi:hypothetical protein